MKQAMLMIGADGAPIDQRRQSGALVLTELPHSSRSGVLT
jgi:hypothetical protein